MVALAWVNSAPVRDDIILRVPAGTEIFDEDQETVLAELDETGQRFVIAKGETAV